MITPDIDTFGKRMTELMEDARSRFLGDLKSVGDISGFDPAIPNLVNATWEVGFTDGMRVARTLFTDLMQEQRKVQVEHKKQYERPS